MNLHDDDKAALGVFGAGCFILLLSWAFYAALIAGIIYGVYRIVQLIIGS